MNKYFIITIDTEGDNLWEWKKGNIISTKNTEYLKRFQNLCNNYGFKPVWLTNYEMMQDPQYVEFISSVVNTNTGEIGMHLHAWNSPPLFDLKNQKNINSSVSTPYLIEFPLEIMEEKIAYMTELIKEKTGIAPVSHRAGRWAMDSRYFDLLIKYGYKIDCSITPGVDWSKTPGETMGSKGSNYSKEKLIPHYIYNGNNTGRILEVPMSVKRMRYVDNWSNKSVRGICRNIKTITNGRNIWIRPGISGINSITKMIEQLRCDNTLDYIMFMIHSSELMPAGSPNFRDERSIEDLYSQINIIFDNISSDFQGVTLKEYYDFFEQDR